MLHIRPEQDRDRGAVRVVNERAFGGPDEADLVETLHGRDKVSLSLVAELDGRVVGHILFSPVSIEPDGGEGTVGLAPMAVLPEHQREGIGSRLVEAGLEACRNAGHARVVVLGHASYYPRFGFAPASSFGVRCAFGVPDEVFMARPLTEGAFDRVSGLALYQPEFGSQATT